MVQMIKGKTCQNSRMRPAAQNEPRQNLPRPPLHLCCCARVCKGHTRVLLSPGSTLSALSPSSGPSAVMFSSPSALEWHTQGTQQRHRLTAAHVQPSAHRGQPASLTATQGPQLTTVHISPLLVTATKIVQLNPVQLEPCLGWQPRRALESDNVQRACVWCQQELQQPT